jgi:probable rRNA maturation factor
MSSVRKLVRSVLELEDVECEEVSIYFVTQRRICDLHKQFFNDPTPTDCISFPIDSEILGEVFICPKTAICYSTPLKQDPYDEVALYIIHGILHLIGYEDIDPNARRAMRKKEKKCMAHCKAIVNLLRPKSDYR